MKLHSFCAANSGDGFISFFDTLLDERNQKVYYIKGGPGCGKSTLMRSLAEQTDEAELIHCSGDPDSLDGVIIPKKNAVIIDATSPHSHEPCYPGVGGNLIDLGVIWNPSKLNKDKIIQLTDQKRFLYQNCYNVLNSAKYIFNGVFQPIKHSIDVQRLKTIGNKILVQNALWEATNQKPNVNKRFLNGITPKGLICYSDTILDLCSNVIVLEDRWMISDYLLKYINELLSMRGIDHIAAYHPLLGKNTLQHIIIPSASLAILTKDGIFPLDIEDERISRKINLQALIAKDFLNDHKNKLRFMKKMICELIDSAVEQLSEIKAIHACIENEYSIGADYTKVDLINKNLSNILFG